MTHCDGKKISTAVLLAAGTGSRLQPLTTEAPKCLTEVNGIAILERLVQSLRSHGFQRLVVVVGYLDEQIRDFLDEQKSEMEIEYVVNPLFATTNNLYSLWLARKSIREDFVLIESDLVFDNILLDGMLSPDRIATSGILKWMNGTTVTLDLLQKVDAFQCGTSAGSGTHFRKTVNMYSFTVASWKRVSDRLSLHVSAGNTREYYETVLAEMVADGSLSLEAVEFDRKRWYEIDTLVDLREAEKLFPGTTPDRDPLGPTLMAS